MNNYVISKKEQVYFWLKVIFSAILYCCIFLVIMNAMAMEDPRDVVARNVFLFYAILIALYIFFHAGIMVGYVKGNAVKVTENQFGELYKILIQQSQQLGLNTVPDLYILQSGGILNAFATTIFGNKFVVLFSEVVQSALEEEDPSVLAFIIGHELGHIKRKHMLKKILLFPSFIIPFLGSAYSRACEYTCDSIGYSLAPQGAKNGLLLLAGGRKLFTRINVKEYMHQSQSIGGFWKWFAEKVSSHPNLPKRIGQFKDIDLSSSLKNSIIKETPKPIETSPDDLSKYMPR